MKQHKNICRSCEKNKAGGNTLNPNLCSPCSKKACLVCAELYQTKAELPVFGICSYCKMGMLDSLELLQEQMNEDDTKNLGYVMGNLKMLFDYQRELQKNK